MKSQKSEKSSGGWSHEEAKKHSIIERLHERCAFYNGGEHCKNTHTQIEDWCERCLAAEEILILENYIEDKTDEIIWLQADIDNMKYELDSWCPNCEDYI